MSLPNKQVIGIIGGGPAGLYATWRLATHGFPVYIFDHKIPWEKPCGGGITRKTYRDFPELNFLLPYTQEIESFDFISKGVKNHATVMDSGLLTIISRKKLGHELLEKVVKSGAIHIKEKVLTIVENKIRTSEKEYFFDFVIGADGAHGISRNLLTMNTYQRWGGIGFYIQGLYPKKADIYFEPSQVGYFWVFPRKDHASVGYIALKGKLSKPEAELKVQSFLNTYYPEFIVNPDLFYSATIPLTRDFYSHQYIGSNWALIGDAAGLVDPITGEGIYYAFASAHFLSESLIEQQPQKYVELLNKKVLPELQKSADILDRFYRPIIIKNMVRLASISPTIANILVYLIAGQQSYITLKKQLIKSLPRVFVEVMFAPFSKKVKL